MDVWQTRMPWPATLAMAGSEQQDAAPVAAEMATRRVSADPTGLDDRALVAATVGGDRSAFDVLVRRHQRTIYAVCYRFAGDHADASDLAQDAFVRAYRGLARFKGDAAFGTWLYRIAVNVCLTRAAAKTPALDPIEPLELARSPRRAPRRSAAAGAGRGPRQGGDRAIAREAAHDGDPARVP